MSGTKAVMLVAGAAGLLFAAVMALSTVRVDGYDCGTAVSYDPPPVRGTDLATAMIDQGVKRQCDDQVGENRLLAGGAGAIGALFLVIGLTQDGTTAGPARDPDGG